METTNNNEQPKRRMSPKSALRFLMAAAGAIGGAFSGIEPCYPDTGWPNPLTDSPTFTKDPTQKRWLKALGSGTKKKWAKAKYKPTVDPKERKRRNKLKAIATKSRNRNRLRTRLLKGKYEVYQPTFKLVKYAHVADGSYRAI